MTKALTSTLVALSITAWAFSPGFADNASTPASNEQISPPQALSQEPSQSQEPEKIADSSSPSPKNSKSLSGIPARLAAFTAGCAIGIPVAIVRRTGIELVEGTKDLAGDTGNWLLLIPAGVIATPFGGVSGGIGGVLYGIKNAWTGSGEEPYGLDSFSLGDM